MEWSWTSLVAACRRRRRLCAFGALSALLTLLVIARHQSGDLPEARWPSAGCLRIFQMSGSLLDGVDRRAGVSVAGCRSDSLSVGQTRACLRRRAARLRRPARLVFIGDSRTRILVEQLQKFLELANVTDPEIVRAEDVPTGPLQSLEIHSISDVCREPSIGCSRTVGNGLITVEYWRRPYMLSLFLQKLQSLLNECRMQSSKCPDIIVLNCALWHLRYIDIQKPIEKSPLAWTVKFREHLQSIRAVLTQLAKETTVVWRLDESITSDVTASDSKVGYQRRLTASHAFYYELQSQVDGLVVWSSMLPETMDFAQRICRPIKYLRKADDPAIQDVIDECYDEIHVGSSMRQRFVSKVFDVICELDGDREPGHCCRG